MKKLLLLLFCLPIIGFGQNIPVSDKIDSSKVVKIKNKKFRKTLNRKLRRKHNNSLAMNPKDQIGYITNLNAHPWGGLNYFNHWGKSLGFYVDYRPAMDGIHPEYKNGALNYDNPTSIPSTLFGQTLWTSITNVGLSVRIFRNKSRAIMMYGGYGATNTKTYYSYDPITEIGDFYYEDGKSISSENYNFGLLLQKKSGISWQIGFDTALSGVNFGIGTSWD